LIRKIGFIDLQSSLLQGSASRRSHRANNEYNTMPMAIKLITARVIEMPVPIILYALSVIFPGKSEVVMLAPLVVRFACTSVT